MIADDLLRGDPGLLPWDLTSTLHLRHVFLTLNPGVRRGPVNGPLLILAGAGSGKTRVITSRIAYPWATGSPAVEIWRSPSRTKAGNAHARRGAAGSDCSRMWVSLHACARLLRREAPAINLSRDVIYARRIS
jgi:hypothetical protein